ncbi:cbb3-type cytochrome c oxidase subunit I [Salinisphaera sp. Q1T1-3]|uniref:cbb3-type cytochrome c oxidase subunit I n=1 Tax=Salinisphaera sp. Q1T1-3 TaxID=2321229 RepID=UPI000E72EBB4|nr:cbb3-type cytochrome c oxidase subunit I [Salinisphaera sp. Q1T1-3]RJS94480.1 cytochrome c oxidase subunit I [Salinisphaera sp. Q1T1-3]
MSQISQPGHRPVSRPHGVAPSRLARWFWLANHKDAGAAYLVLAAIMFLVGSGLSLVIRSELFAPGIQFVDPAVYNQVVTLHGLIMIFGGIMPAFTGFAVMMLPAMIGAPGMAWARLSGPVFWLLPLAVVLLLSTPWIGGGAPQTGWTMYPPLIMQTGASLPVFIVAVCVTALSGFISSANVFVTLIRRRAPGMALLRMPLFGWTWLVTAFLVMAVMPVLAATMLMLGADRYLATDFFGGPDGSALLYQHLFWTFGHPEVYIMVLPAFGLVSTIIPSFARKRLFGYNSMVYATVSIGFLSFMVWAHHMFTTGLPLPAELFFMFSTMIISVPTGVKVFNWVATMWGGAMTFEAPMLFSTAFVVMFMVGGFSGLMSSLSPVDFQYHDTYFVVAHFHYVLVPGSIFAMTAALYYWMPKWTGVMYSEGLARLHFWWSVVWINVLFFPMHFVGLAGMPRRIADYNTQFTDFNQVISLGAAMFFLGQFLFVYNMGRCLARRGPAALARPWDGARGLEWTLASPWPHESFTQGARVDARELAKPD